MLGGEDRHQARPGKHVLEIKEQPVTSESIVSDARNRAFRTLIQGLFFDVAAALCVILYTAFSTASDWDDIEWAVLWFLLAKTFIVSALSYLMRTVFKTVIPPQE